ncbi:MAG TPA: hypothetical protein VD886_14195 [Herpetosiphonaceae bacterium]|nr:hypothetical protein [Herpetosiphonaceae bacterium]
MQSLSRSRPARRFWLRTLPLRLLGLMVLVFGLIVWASLNGAVPRFEPAAWQSARSDDQLRAQRYDVLDDLRQNYLRYGTPRARVLEWLGEPDALDQPVPASNRLAYALGSIGLFLPDRMIFQISFDEQDRLLATSILYR